VIQAMNKGLPRRTAVLDPAAFAIGKKDKNHVQGFDM
jgi:hypothetical protein